MGFWLWVRALAAIALRRRGTSSTADLANAVLMLETEGEQVVSAALALGAARYALGVMPLVRLLENPHRFWVERGAAAVALGDYGEAAFAALPALARAARYEWREGDESWDERAHIAVLDAIDHRGTGQALAAQRPRGSVRNVGPVLRSAPGSSMPRRVAVLFRVVGGEPLVPSLVAAVEREQVFEVGALFGVEALYRLFKEQARQHAPRSVTVHFRIVAPESPVSKRGWPAFRLLAFRYGNAGSAQPMSRTAWIVIGVALFLGWAFLLWVL